MKIEKVETIGVDKFLYVQITTDTGITGLGEAGMWGYVAANEAVIKQWTPYLIGKDPLMTEHHWNYLHRAVAPDLLRGSVPPGQHHLERMWTSVHTRSVHGWFGPSSPTSARTARSPTAEALYSLV